MPRIEPRCVMSDVPGRAIPKSVSFTAPHVIDDRVGGLEIAVNEAVKMDDRAARSSCTVRSIARPGSSGARIR